MSSTLGTPLTDLLGDTRGRIVQLLGQAPLSVGDLAGELGLSEVAVRRHLAVLEGNGLVAAQTVRRRGPGRPGAQYRLTARAERLFPDRSADFANELMEFVETAHGRGELLAFLRWRAERHEHRYAEAMPAGGASGTAERTQRLAELLTDDGFAAEVTPARGQLQLSQHHCAIKDLARAHPEICAWEAGMFSRLLGTRVSRRQTIASGAGACLCHIGPATTDVTESTEASQGAPHGNSS